MNNNARNPIPEELHVYRHDEGIGNGTTPAGVEWLDRWCSIAIDISPRWGAQLRRNNQVMERGWRGFSNADFNVLIPDPTQYSSVAGWLVGIA